jgi:hypothetical protein
VLAGAPLGNMAAFQANDNSYYQVSSPTFGSAADYYATLTSVPALPSSLSVVYTAKTSVTCTAMAYVWNWGSSTWTSFDSRTLTTAETTATKALTGSLAQYVSGNTMRVRLRCSRFTAGQFTVSTDVLKVNFS